MFFVVVKVHLQVYKSTDRANVYLLVYERRLFDPAEITHECRLSDSQRITDTSTIRQR